MIELVIHRQLKIEVEYRGDFATAYAKLKFIIRYIMRGKCQELHTPPRTRMFSTELMAGLAHISLITDDVVVLVFTVGVFLKSTYQMCLFLVCVCVCLFVCTRARTCVCVCFLT